MKNLSQQFPISGRFIIEINLLWIFGLFGLILLVAYTDIEVPLLQHNLIIFDDFNIEGLTFVFGILLILSVKLIYAYLYRATFKYNICDDMFIISHGVIRRETSTLPLSRVTEIHIGRSWRDILLGLYSVDVLTPGTALNHFNQIPGLSFSTASGLSQYLTKAIENQAPTVKTATASSP